MQPVIERVVWAIDPRDGVGVDTGTVRALSEWAKGQGVQIEPVYVFTPIPGESLVSEKVSERIRASLRSYEIETAAPSLVANPSHSTSGAGRALLDHAEDSKAGLIVISSSGRTGQAHMLFGSFAEFLVNSSTVPLLILNRKPPTSGVSFAHCLWPTKFSEQCQYAFRRFLHRSRGICRRITLCPLTGVDRSQVMPAFRTLQKTAEEKGFDLGIYLDALKRKSDDVLKAARSVGAGMITLAAQPGPFSSVVFGAWAQKIFHSSEIPIWIYGPRVIEQAEIEDSEIFENGTINEPILRAVLSALTDRMSKNEMTEFAAHLPSSLKKTIEESSARGARPPLESDFLADVRGRLGVPPGADIHDSIRAVIAALEGRFRADEIKKIKALHDVILQIEQTGI